MIIHVGERKSKKDCLRYRIGGMEYFVCLSASSQRREEACEDLLEFRGAGPLFGLVRFDQAFGNGLGHLVHLVLVHGDELNTGVALGWIAELL